MDDNCSLHTYPCAQVYLQACHHANCVKYGKDASCYNALSESVENRFWNRLVCKDSESVYEVKITNNIASMMKKIEDSGNGINGGPYYNRYHALVSTLPSTGKLYIALVPTEVCAFDET
jgi:hypothetical protein